MPDFLDEKRKEIAARLAELAPRAKEYHKLMAMMAVLDEPDAASETPPAAPPPVSAKPLKAKSKSGKKRGRPKGSGTRAAEALALVKKSGSKGISIPDLALKMGIKPNYLYRVLPGLADDGLVEKRGPKWFAKSA